MGFYLKLKKQIKDTIANVPVCNEDRLRLNHYFVFLLAGVPTMLFYGAYNLFQGNYLPAAITALSVVILISGGFLVLHFKNVKMLYRISVSCFAALLVYLLVLDENGGARCLWIYTFPLTVFFLMGKREGLFWSCLMLALTIPLMMKPFAREVYSGEFILRFFSVYLLISIMSYWFEHFRFSYHQMLLKEHRLFQEMIEYSRDIIYRRNIKTGEYQYISHAFCEILGYPLPEVEAMQYHNVEALIHPDDREQYRAVAQKAIARPVSVSESYTVEYRMRHRNGHYYWFSNQTRVIPDADGAPEFIIGVNREITDERMTKQSLKKARDQLFTILNSVDAHIFVADLKTYQILFMNRQMKKDFGYDQEGGICWKVFCREEHPCIYCTNDRLLNQMGEPSGVIEWEHFNPVTRRWYNNYDRAIQWIDGKWVRIQIAVDITRMKEMEEERQRNEKALQRAGQLEAIGTLAGGIAHDFNNLLQVIFGYLSLLKTDKTISLSTCRYLKKIEKASGKALELSNSLLTFSTGGIPSKLKVPIPPLLENIALDAVKNTEIDCEFNFPPGLWTPRIDRIQMGSALKNIIINACESMKEEGRIEISAENFHLSTRNGDETVSPGTYVKISIRDNGCGMTPSIISKIFNPYYSTKRMGPNKGVGLGLSIAYSIIRQHQGSVTISSQPDVGTTAMIYLPAKN